MIIKNILENNITITEYVNFEFTNKDKYLNKFDEFKERGRIKKSCNFYDDKWIIKVGGEELSIVFPTRLQFQTIVKAVNISFEELNLGYRYYILEVSDEYSYIDQLNCSLKNFLLDNKDDIKKSPHNSRKILEFLNFMDIEEYFFEKINIILSADQVIYGTRMLPSFSSIFKFINLVNQFEYEASTEELKIFYPILLWWKITSIIPQRPSEFLNINYDCLELENGNYFIKVKRSKPKDKAYVKNRSNVDEYYKEQRVCVSKSIYNFIDNYRNFIMQYISSEEINNKLIPNKLNLDNKKKIDVRTVNEKIFTKTDFRCLLNRFFEEIVSEKYKFKVVSRLDEQANIDSENIIEELVPYDSRHIAILNLIIMGNDYKTVMSLAGHASVNTTQGYYNHVEEYINAYSIAYVKKLKNNIIDEDNFIIVDNSYYGKSRLDKILGTNYKFKVNGGICTYNLEQDKEPCLLVEGKHYKCKYFVARDKIFIDKEELIIKNKIKSEIKILQDLVEKRKQIAQFDKKYNISIEKIRLEIKNLITLSKERL